MKRILVFGIGNPGRGDDALGSFVIERLESWAAEQQLGDALTLDANYQLMAEDALAVSEHDIVIFVDASMEHIDGLLFTRVHPAGRIAFSTHAMSAESIVALAQELYGCETETYMLHLEGASYEFQEPLSRTAERALESGVRFLTELIAETHRTGELPTENLRA